MKALRQKTHVGLTGRAPRAAGWSAAYLVVAGALIAIAGADLSGPSPERRARALERRTARELAAVVETASALAGSRAEENERRAAEREAALGGALATVRSWLERFDDPAGRAELQDALGRAAPELARSLPDGLVAAVVAPSGEKVFETGGALDLDSPGALLASAGDGLTAAVAWAEEPSSADSTLAEAIRAALAAGLAPGTGLYFVAADGSVATEITARPAPAMAAAAPLAAGSVKSVVGDLETGRLVSARRSCGRLGWTVVAERFLSPEVLAGGSRGPVGMFALAGLGIVAAAAFAHAFHAGVVRNPPAEDAVRRVGPAGDTPVSAPLRAAVEVRRERYPSAAPAPQAGMPEPEVFPTGESIIRLRESLGTVGEGPDLAACAKSQILRALSRCVRHPGPVAVPREVREWGRRAFAGEKGPGQKAA